MKWIEIMPTTTRTSVLSTVFKADSRKKLLNYRPLSMPNCDYRIQYSEYLTLYLQSECKMWWDSIINTYQSFYIKGRNVECRVRNIIDIYDICEKNNTTGAFLCLDFKKDFDSLEHSFIEQTWQRFKFGQDFILKGY